MTSRTIRNAEDWTKFAALIADMEFPFCVVAVKGNDRTAAQNRLIHKWFGEVAAHRGDTTMQEVKAECNLSYGKPILMRDDPEWGAIFGYLFESLPYEKKLLAIRKLDVPFTRQMKVKQLSEYMDQMQRDYRGQGVQLTDPEGLSV